MSQVISKSHGSDGFSRNPSERWPMVAFHAGAATIYGYAIGWQNVSG